MSKWIKIEDQKPKHKQVCICCSEDGQVSIQKWWSEFEGMNMWTYTNCNEKVGIYAPVGFLPITHWMPLPEVQENIHDAKD